MKTESHPPEETSRTMAKLSANRAAKEAGVAKKTLLEAMNKGRLSASKNDKGHWEIDPAELFRVFPKQEPTPHEEPKPTPLENTQNHSENSALKAELKAVREMLEREQEQAADQIADLRQRLDSETEERRKLTAQLTDQRPTAPEPQKRGLFGWMRAGG